MYLRQIHYFVAVGQAGSFSAAAKFLNLSQPALGYQVKLLEERLGVKLLQRHSRGVVLTEAGRVLLQRALHILDSLAEAERALAPFRREERTILRFGAAPTPGRALLPDLMQYLSERGSVELEVRQGLSDEFVRLIEAGALDAALCYDPPAVRNAEIVPLYCEDLFLVGRPEIARRARSGRHGAGKIAVRDLHRIPLIVDGRLRSTRLRIEEAFGSMRDTLDLLEIEPADLKREFILRHDRCAIVPFGLFREDIEADKLTARRIVSPRLTRMVALVLAKASSTAVSKWLRPPLLKLVERKMRSFRWDPPVRGSRRRQLPSMIVK